MTPDSPAAEARLASGLTSSAAMVDVSQPPGRNSHTAVVGAVSAPSAAITVGSADADGSAAEGPMLPTSDDLTQGRVLASALASTACILRLPVSPSKLLLKPAFQ